MAHKMRHPSSDRFRSLLSLEGRFLRERIFQTGAVEESRGKEDIFIMKKFFMNEEGQGMVEYGLIIALVAVVVIAAITLLGNGVRDKFNEITDNLG